MKNTKFMDLKIQLFAESGESDVDNKNAEQKSEAKKTLVDLLKENPDYQSEFDKLSAKSIETALNKAKEQAEKEKKDAEELAKLSEAERQKKILDNKEKELKDREDKVALANMKLEAIKILNEKDIDVELVDFVIDVDANTTNENIKKLESAFSKAVQKAVENRLKGRAPGTATKNNSTNENGVTDFISVIKDNQVRK